MLSSVSGTLTSKRNAPSSPLRTSWTDWKIWCVTWWTASSSPPQESCSRTSTLYVTFQQSLSLFYFYFLCFLLNPPHKHWTVLKCNIFLNSSGLQTPQEAVQEDELLGRHRVAERARRQEGRRLLLWVWRGECGAHTLNGKSPWMMDWRCKSIRVSKAVQRSTHLQFYTLAYRGQHCRWLSSRGDLYFTQSWKQSCQ